MALAPRPSLVMSHGQGSWLYDEDGQCYLDFVQGWAVNCLGHCPEPVIAALRAQAEALLNCSPAFHNRPALSLAEQLAQSAFGGQVLFASTGAEANEGAIKLARKWGAARGAFEIITLQGSFHGRTLATMSASGKPQFKPLFEPKVAGFTHVERFDLAAVEAAIGKRTVAVMLEPVLGEGGVWPATVEYLQGLRKLTSERGLLLILDEIQTGMGRTGSLFAYQEAGIEPDIMTLGKGLGGGLPLSALLATDAVCCFEPGDQGGTFNANPFVVAGGLAVLQTLQQPGFLAGVRARSAQLVAGLEALSTRCGLGSVRGRGLLLALELAPDGRQPPVLASRVVSAARQEGLLLNAPTATALRFMPALNVSEAEVEQALVRLESALSQAR